MIPQLAETLSFTAGFPQTRKARDLQRTHLQRNFFVETVLIALYYCQRWERDAYIHTEGGGDAEAEAGKRVGDKGYRNSPSSGFSLSFWSQSMVD